MPHGVRLGPERVCDSSHVGRWTTWLDKRRTDVEKHNTEIESETRMKGGCFVIRSLSHYGFGSIALRGNWKTLCFGGKMNETLDLCFMLKEWYIIWKMKATELQGAYLYHFAFLSPFAAVGDFKSHRLDFKWYYRLLLFTALLSIKASVLTSLWELYHFIQNAKRHFC